MVRYYSCRLQIQQGIFLEYHSSHARGHNTCSKSQQHDQCNSVQLRATRKLINATIKQTNITINKELKLPENVAMQCIVFRIASLFCLKILVNRTIIATVVLSWRGGQVDRIQQQL